MATMKSRIRSSALCAIYLAATCILLWSCACETRKTENRRTGKFEKQLSVSEHLQSTNSLGQKKNGPEHACPMGSSCDACPRNRFGQDCVPCPKCSSAPGESQGRCDDGEFGMGSCVKVADAGRPAFMKCHDLKKPCPLNFRRTPGDLVMAALLTSKVDLQRENHQLCSISDTKWYSSVKRLRLSAIVLHDCLSDEDVVKIQSNEVRFLRINVPDDMTVNDIRFVVYFGILSGQVFSTGDVQHIKMNARWAPSVRKVFMTDLFDVHFTGNPFEIVFGDRYHVYVGNEENAPTSPEYGGWNSWLLNQARHCSGLTDDVLRNQKTNMTGGIVNAGIVGGRVTPVLSLLRLMSLHMLSNGASVRKGICDMYLLNKCIHDLFAIDSVFSGFPLHNTFKGGEASSQAYIIHK